MKPNDFKLKPLMLALAGICANGMTALPAIAVTRYWDGNGASEYWGYIDSDPNSATYANTNWTENSLSTIPINGDDLVFKGNDRLSNFNNIHGLTLNSITFDFTAGEFRLFGRDIRLNGGMKNESFHHQIVFIPINIGGNQVWDGGVEGMSLIGPLNLGNHALTMSNQTKMISGDYDLTVGGSGNAATPVARLTLNAGSFLDTRSGAIGKGNGGRGQVSLIGAGTSWEDRGDLIVGGYGNGSLSIAGGATVTSAKKGVLGEEAASSASGEYNGVATVSGEGSSWTNGGSLTVGLRGKGSLIVDNGGLVRDTDGFVASELDSGGNVVVNGQGSIWQNSGYVKVAQFGSGLLTISNGGTVQSANGVLGEDRASTPSEINGRAFVDGVGSNWTNSGFLRVGARGQGQLTVQNGGLARNADGYAGSAKDGRGYVTVTGTGSRWENRGNLTIGGFGEGYVEVSKGGALTSESGLLGYDGGAGSVKIVDENSSWTVTGNITAGRVGGLASVDVRSGGSVVADSAYLGISRDTRGRLSHGSINVEDAGSSWLSNGELSIGHADVGDILIQGGGYVRDRIAYLGYGAASTGKAYVSGTDSKWENLDGVVVGRQGEGELLANNGGKLMGGGSVIGEQTNSKGLATIRGQNSEWYINGGLSVGKSGNGTLNIENKALVSSWSTVIGLNSGSSGTLKVSGPDSLLSNDNGQIFAVGVTGDGMLVIENGGKVINRGSFLGFDGGHGTALITGNGSNWTNNGNLYVAGTQQSASQHGEVSVTNGGTLDVAGSATIWEKGSVSVNGGTINVGNGIVNHGRINVNGLADGNEIHADIDNVSGGKINIGDFSSASFFGDVNHNGADIYIGNASEARFFGSLTGNGSYTGTGTLIVEGEFSPNNEGTALVGVEGNMLLDSDSIANMGIAGLAKGDDEYDAVIIQGNLFLDGTLNVSLRNGFTPNFGDTFELFAATTIFGAFENVIYPELSGGLSWQLNKIDDIYQNRELLTITAVPLPSAAWLFASGLFVLLKRRAR